MTDDAKPIFTIRIIYKSGATMDFDATSFEVDYTSLGGNPRFTWTAANAAAPRPLVIGAGDIAAVWQIDAKDAA